MPSPVTLSTSRSWPRTSELKHSTVQSPASCPLPSSVTQSTFKNPCTFNGTIDSGFRPSNNVTGLIPANFTVAVNNTNPVWFYCAQTNGTNHCQAGMVFAINPGNGVLATGNTTLAQYQINANMSGTSNSTGTNSTGNSTGTSSSPAPSHSSGAGSVARNTAGVLAVVGAAFGLLL
jgi:hypothetical protein